MLCIARRRDSSPLDDALLVFSSSQLAEMNLSRLELQEYHRLFSGVVMSRTPLFAAVKKALTLASRDNSIVWPGSSALTRRRMMELSAAAAGAAVLSPVLDWSAYAKKEQLKGPIGIVGGGVAGLTAAYRLHQAGRTPIVFEASNRWGGRMFTQYDFYKGMFCKRGGELVDSNHCDLKNLLCELGLKTQEFEDEGKTLYFFKGAFRTDKDLLNPLTQCGAYVPIAKQILTDRGKQCSRL